MAKTPSSCRLGVDIGGTFTDVALEVDGVITSTKVLTDYESHERAVIDAVREVTAAAGVTAADIKLLIHGTTLATNALIERSGARTAFITTEGFRDVIEMRTENRFEQYDLDIVLPPPLIERGDRFTLRERIDARGNVLVPLDTREAAALARHIVDAGFESVAVGFLHSYLDGRHERAVRDALVSASPALSVSISSEVSPQMREFERFNTVCANAYVKPAIKSYLDRLISALAGIGIGCPILVMHSGGGIVSVETASEFPVRLMESGPAGGAIFAADLARRHRLPKVVSFDMGGTTAKICLIEDSAPKTATTFEVARTYRFKKGSGMPISIPVVEMVEIGAGGGSIAGVDAMRRIRVGPQSAGSTPGPACYQRGGTAPTVTDADLTLGRLDPDNFAGGAIRLSRSAATNAIAAGIGGGLGLDVDSCAHGIAEMVDENMGNAGRVHAVENGKDLSGFSLITFGGAGPLHAARLCEKMGIATFIVPPGAGVGSAIGFLRAPFAYQAVRTAVLRLSTFDAGAADRIIDGLASEAASFLAWQGAGDTPQLELTAFMRYVGQGWEIPVALPAEAGARTGPATLRTLFEEAYSRFYGRPVEGLDVEVVSWSAKASLPPPPAAEIASTEWRKTAKPAVMRRCFDAARQGFIDTGVHQREALSTGDHILGPAIIVERETATVIPSTFEALILSDGSIRATRTAVTAGGAV
jgi:N-methylhydantoinase A